MSGINLLIPDTFGRGEASPRPDAFLAGRLSGATMGTAWSAAWYAPPGTTERDMRLALEAGFAEIIRSMSTWEPDSLISRYNQLGPGERIHVDHRFAEVMQMALDVAHRSGGAFDPCLGGAVMRRGFGAPNFANGNAGLAYGAPAWARIASEPDVLMQPGGVLLDLSAIAKGYAVDCMAGVMEQHGISQFLGEIGGEYVGRGVKPDGMPWWVDLENPYPEGDPWRLALCGAALATSGDYRQTRIVDGETVSHIVPFADRQCKGGDLASVSVLHPSCAIADAWATALFASGDTAGMALAEREGLAVLFQYRDRAPCLSSSMRAWLD